ncbi:MAG: hypothetical protein JNJ71_07295 [Rubrivivax sp.]|nr:hypothetical protein [Rubrivivax sp.]
MSSTSPNLSASTPPSEECLHEFDRLEKRKELGYLVCKICPNKEGKDEIAVERSGFARFSELVGLLPADQPRYVIFRVNTRPTDRVLFILWRPDSSKIKQKMTYVSSCESFKSKLFGIRNHLDATSPEDLELEQVADLMKCTIEVLDAVDPRAQ